MLCNMKLDMKVIKKYDKVKLSHKNVNVVEKNYITAQKYLSTKGKLVFLLANSVTMTTPR